MAKPPPLLIRDDGQVDANVVRQLARAHTRADASYSAVVMRTISGIMSRCRTPSRRDAHINTSNMTARVRDKLAHACSKDGIRQTLRGAITACTIAHGGTFSKERRDLAVVALGQHHLPLSAVVRAIAQRAEALDASARNLGVKARLVAELCAAFSAEFRRVIMETVRQDQPSLTWCDPRNSTTQRDPDADPKLNIHAHVAKRQETMVHRLRRLKVARLAAPAPAPAPRDSDQGADESPASAARTSGSPPKSRTTRPSSVIVRAASFLLASGDRAIPKWDAFAHACIVVPDTCNGRKTPHTLRQKCCRACNRRVELVTKPSDFNGTIACATWVAVRVLFLLWSLNLRPKSVAGGVLKRLVELPTSRLRAHVGRRCTFQCVHLQCSGRPMPSMFVSVPDANNRGVLCVVNRLAVQCFGNASAAQQ